ncbi:hypothetical protein PHYPSEUDO_015131 [Phytophthora pseudosyringae]|uniref:Uncharacterized protein n=1 Tax=Phytophthora pseudosyringae TaxID=221518 RepID=A0A8T1V4H3_9STRA|nr:hypothetical protein PHYPSEUDO_015131 [Phytophthora pseudosyringae]
MFVDTSSGAEVSTDAMGSPQKTFLRKFSAFLSKEMTDALESANTSALIEEATVVRLVTSFYDAPTIDVLPSFTPTPPSKVKFKRLIRVNKQGCDIKSSAKLLQKTLQLLAKSEAEVENRLSSPNSSEQGRL